LIDLRRCPIVGVVSASVAAVGLEDPPELLGLVAHPLRWRLLRELTASDRAVRELTERVGVPQNLISYHLRQLRDGGLVSTHRSTADGRDTYYAIDLTRCEQQLRAAGGALHPALLFTAPPSASSTVSATRRPRRVLFLCTGNSARSQMAEALLERAGGGSVRAASAGSHPKPLHPNAVRVMERRGIDISGNRTKHLDELISRRFDLVVTLCDRVREVCPELPSHPVRAHWSMPDPSQAGATNRASYPAFERTATELETRIRFLLAQLSDPSSPKPRRSSHAER
jgi:protein-tyrosine-phosphatase/DNA-binding transcriptional ArsR family regulator